MKQAERAGVPSHTRYAKSLTSREVSEQIALANIDPPLESKTDWLLSQLCYLIAQTNAKKGKKFKLNQFRVWLREQPKSEEEQKQAVKAWTASFGKKGKK